MSPDEAILIIKGWLESKSELLLSASMINFSVYARCRVVAVEDGKVTVWSLKEDAVVSFSVDSPSLSLRYSEMRELSDAPGFEHVSIPEGKALNSALVITLPLKEIDPSVAPLRLSAERIILLQM
jgi:hypothetical protein